MIQISNRDYRKQFAFVAALTCITTLLSFSKLGAEGPTWRLIPDERHKTVWRVGSNGAISKIKFPVYYEEENCKFCNFEISPSPDQSKIAYIKKNDLWIYDIEKKKDQRCTKVGRPETEKFASVYVSISTWSPESKIILYSVLGGDIYSEPQDLKVRSAKYGDYLYDISKSASTYVERSLTHLGPVWLPNGKFLFSLYDKAPFTLWGELRLYDPVTLDSRRVVEERAWYGRPMVSDDGRWALVNAGKRLGPDTVSPGKDLRSQLKRIDLVNGKVIDVTPLGGWGDYWSSAISPSGKNITYFVKKSHNPTPSDPNNYRGLLVVNGVEIYSSDLLAYVYWINERTIVAVTLKELLVLDAQSGKVIGSCQRN